MNPEDYTTEYLILNENSINWEVMSGLPSRPLSLVEIRLFRKHINWYRYITTHGSTMSPQMIETASKYFTPQVYTLLNYVDMVSEEFVINHMDKFNIPVYIISKMPSEEFILKTMDKWHFDDVIVKILKERLLEEKYKNNYPTLKLMFEVE